MYFKEIVSNTVYTTSFYARNQKNKKVISKISVDSSFTFISYAYMIMCICIICSVDYCVKIALFQTEMVSA